MEKGFDKKHIWTRGESNPCPKANSLSFYECSRMFFYSLRYTTIGGLIPSVASYYAQMLKALQMSFPATMMPVSYNAGLTRRTAAISGSEC